MNKDQSKGRAKETEGKVQKKYGEVTGDKEHEAEGKAKETEGKAKKSWGDIKNDIANKIDE